tara:strand:+ start:150 stop:377 length:228 start_codon:yes stop_codon:yes gene_type:complete
MQLIATKCNLAEFAKIEKDRHPLLSPTELVGRWERDGMSKKQNETDRQAIYNLLQINGFSHVKKISLIFELVLSG